MLRTIDCVMLKQHGVESRYHVGHHLPRRLRQEGNATFIDWKRAEVECRSIPLFSIVIVVVVRSLHVIHMVDNTRLRRFFAHVASNRVLKTYFNLPLRAVIPLNFTLIAILN